MCPLTNALQLHNLTKRTICHKSVAVSLVHRFLILAQNLLTIDLLRCGRHTL